MLKPKKEKIPAELLASIKRPHVVICFSVSGDVFIHQFLTAEKANDESRIPDEHRKLQKVRFDLRDMKVRMIAHD